MYMYILMYIHFAVLSLIYDTSGHINIFIPIRKLSTKIIFHLYALPLIFSLACHKIFSHASETTPKWLEKRVRGWKSTR